MTASQLKQGDAERPACVAISARDFSRSFDRLILLTWTMPPVVGLGFLLFIQMFSLEQMQIILQRPLEPLFIIGSLVFAYGYFRRITRPLRDYLDGRRDAAAALAVVRAFPLHFWAVFLLYLLVAPSTVILSAEWYAGFEPQPVDWFRIHMVSLIVSILVGLPIFFLIFDLFGRALATIPLERPYVTIRARVFLIGALTPLLVDTMLVQYYWTRTGYFTFETFLIWVWLELLAIAGSLIFAHSFRQSLEPMLAIVTTGADASVDAGVALLPQSTDELGVMTGRYKELLSQLAQHNEMLEIANRVLRSSGAVGTEGETYDRIVSICQSALRADTVLLTLYDDSAQTFISVAQSGLSYNPDGHLRIPYDEQSITGAVFVSAQTLAIDDVTTDARASQRVVRALEARSCIAAPLLVEDKVLGVLMAVYQRHPRYFNGRDTLLIEGLAREAAVVVQTQSLQRQRLEAERRFADIDQMARVTLCSIGDGVITTDISGAVQFLNPVAEQLTGWKSAEATGQLLSHIMNLVDETSLSPLDDLVRHCVQHGISITVPGHTLLQDRHGDKEFSVQVRISPIRDAHDKCRGTVLVFHDVTELRLLARRLSYQASHDALTGLLNRRAFEARLELAVDDARSRDLHHALCFMDLDNFKVVNDTCGHLAGDELLKQLAIRLRAAVREVDTLARIGGDEFALLLEACSLERARQIAESIMQTMNEFRFAWHDKIFNIGMTIGIVPVSAVSGSLTDVLGAADSACYAAKALGRNRVHVLQEADIALAERQGEMQWLQRIRHALDNNDFALYIQPIAAVGARDSAVRHGEILLRLHVEGQEVAVPGAFLPAAERYHLMPAIDRWVVRHALAELSRRQQDGCCLYSINISGQTLCDDRFLAFVLDQIERTGVEPSQVCFEITETAAIANLSRAIAFITALRARGCRFALDDFGSGLSSFAYLKNLPVNYLKIDGAFVREMASNDIDRAMVSSINEIGHLMGIETVAEYVMSGEILEALQRIGVDYAQGFHISHPIPLEREFAA